MPRDRRRGGDPQGGLPLGAAFSAEVWEIAKTAILAGLCAAGFGGYVHRNNAQAWALQEEHATADRTADRTARRQLPPATQMLGDGGSAASLVARRRATGKTGAERALPATPPEVAARRIGKLALTPLSAEVEAAAMRVRDKARGPDDSGGGSPPSTPASSTGGGR